MNTAKNTGLKRQSFIIKSDNHPLVRYYEGSKEQANKLADQMSRVFGKTFEVFDYNEAWHSLHF